MEVRDAGHLLEEIRRRLRDDDRDALAALLVDAHPADLAGALRELELPDQVTVLRQLPREAAGTVLYEMDDGSRLALMEALDQGEVSRILDQMPPDEAADVVETLPEEQASRILHEMPRDEAEEIQELLQYGESTAGGIMTPEFIAVHEEMTVAPGAGPPPEVGDPRGRLLRVRRRRPRSPGRPRPAAAAHHGRPVDHRCTPSGARTS